MLDVKFIRKNPQIVEEALKNRATNNTLGSFLQIEEKRRIALGQVESLKAERNRVSKEVGRLKQQGQNASSLLEQTKLTGEQISTLEEALKQMDEQLTEILHGLPNLPHETVPIGPDDSANIEVRRWGKPADIPGEALNHWDIGANLGILDFERAGKISGTRFTVYRGLGARLERAVINFFLDQHTRYHGYTEILPPFMVNSASMFGTGQLPKFKEDMFHVEGTDYYLVPTAEVPLTNLHAGEILEAEQLPIHYTAYTACFRAEAGAAGRDTRGLIRQHQFNKVELVKLSLPENSFDELEKMTHDAEDVLQKLGLPYRTVCLSTGDMGFCSAKTYDIEVWLPGFAGYREISSCSNCTDFQARRANIRFRREGGKPEFVHTLNGSGVAVGRTVVAILENYLQADGSVKVPEALVAYMGCELIK
ncbi:MAG: serine--tRNA ligase [Clostridiales bacterium]|nr:serine--tRNA ligase [Clostridiales bacterium]